MIPFFRKIRKTLADDNKPIKYLRYAIGEIVLVVIGILIALQINTWNENRKERFIEQKILLSLNNDLETDISNMKSMISNDSTLNQTNIKLIKLLKDSLAEYNSSYDKMLGNINRYDLFYPQKMGYEALKSRGLEILRNDNLKSQIVNLYDFQYALIAESMDLKKQLYLDTNLIFNEQLQTVINDTSANIGFSFIKTPNDFKALKLNNNFMGNLTHITVEQFNFIIYDRAILKIMETTKANIEHELKK
jgi:hypothetical protein